MAKRSKNEDVAFDENAPVEATEQELTEGETPKKKRTPSPRKLLADEITQYLFDNTGDLPAPLQELVERLKAMPKRGRRAGAGRGPSITGQIKAMILEQNEIHEDVFYEQFKAGRLEMKRKFYNLHKKVANPEDAIWVSFNPETGMYHLDGTGAEPPANWDLS